MAKLGSKHSPNARVSPEEALFLLNMPPGEAADAISKAIHRHKCRVYCNGNIVAARMLPDIRVAAVPENDGRWTAAVQSISNQWPGHIFRWGLVRTEVEALRKDAPQKDAALWLPLEFENDPCGPDEKAGEYVDRIWERLQADPSVRNVGRMRVWNLYCEWRKRPVNG